MGAIRESIAQIPIMMVSIRWYWHTSIGTDAYCLQNGWKSTLIPTFIIYHLIFIILFGGKKTTTSFHMRKNLWIDEKKTFESVLSNFYILLCLEFRRKKEHQMKHKERSLNIFMAHKRSRWPIHMHTHSRKISAEEDVKSMASAQKVQNLSTFYMVIKRT